MNVTTASTRRRPSTAESSSPAPSPEPSREKLAQCSSRWGGGVADDDSLFCCQDCGHDTKLMRERYMVRDEIWEYATYYHHARMLCVNCLEGRLGRRLGHEDFINCPLNYSDGMTERHSLRLMHRLVTTNGETP